MSGKFFYLATPYSKFPGGRHQAFSLACSVAGDLVREGIPVFAPIVHTHPIAEFCAFDPLDLWHWLANDLPFMEASIGLLVCEADGWQESEGMRIEMEFFTQQNKPIMHLTNPWLPVYWPIERMRNILSAEQAFK